MTDLHGRHILVVEDNALIAGALADMLEEAGAIVLGPFGWIEEALGAVHDVGLQLDGAVLDVDLHGDRSFPVADALMRSGIGFVFITGYDGEAIEPRYRALPRCEKPLEAATILPALRRAMAGAANSS